MLAYIILLGSIFVAGFLLGMLVATVWIMPAVLAGIMQGKGIK